MAGKVPRWGYPRVRVIAFVLSCVVVGLCASRISRAARGIAIETRQLIFLVAASAQIVASMQVAGFIVRSLAGASIAVINMLVLVPVWLRTKPRVAVRCRARPTRPTRPWRLTAAVWRCARREPLCCALSLGVIVLVGARAIEALMFPPTGYDALWYHLPSIAAWLQSGRISTVAYSPIIGRYPANTELLWAFPAALLQTGRFLAVSGVVALAVLGLGVRALARSTGLSASNAVSAGAVAVLTPVALAQSVANLVDLVVAAWVVAAAAFVHEAAKAAARHDRRHVYWFACWCGVAVGLAVGSKYSSLSFALVALVSVVWVVYRSSVTGSTWRAVALFLLPVFVLGSAWYVHNVVADANPLSPFHTEIAGFTVFNGPAQPGQWLSEPPQDQRGRSKPAQLVRSWIEDAKLTLHPRAVSEEQRHGGLGPFWPLLGLPCVVVAAAAVARRRSVSNRRAHGVAALLIVAGALGQPYWWWSRFTIPFVALGAISFFHVADATKHRYRVVIRTAAAVLALAGGVLGVARIGYPENRWSGGPSSALSLVRDQGGFVPYGRVMGTYAWVDALPDGSHIGVDTTIETGGGFVLFPLFGLSLDNHVDSLAAPDADPTTHPGAMLNSVAAVVAARDGALQRTMSTDPQFVRIDESPDGLTVFVRRTN